MFLRIGSAWIVVCLIIAASSYGMQNSPTAGTLAGTIRDVSGAFVPGAMITVRSAATNQTRRTSSGGDGTFRLVALPVGDYEFRVDVPGFDPYVNPTLTIALGRTVLLDITLNLAGVAEHVAVTYQPAPIDPTATATTTTIDPERIEELPVNSRNYLEFTLLAPGVAPSNPQSSGGTRGQFGTPLADSGFTFGGLRPRSNSIAIDGLDNTDETTGAARVALSPEIVREFQIVNNGISAESGGAAGGAINVVTKTGTNTFHGDALVFGQNELFNARESVTAKAGVGRPLFHRYQPGVSLGGPIQHDRLNDISSRGTSFIAVSISNAPLTIWSGSRCIVLQVVRNLPTPNQVQIWFRIATQNSGFLFRRGSNVAKSRRRRNDDHKEKTGETSDSSYRFSCRYLLWGCRGLAPSTSAFNIKPRLNPD